ncbi:hypothetical protein PCANC_23750 [Puccinia coronata f. sp. avenae]|uniref:Uncharacterized protein n=1 Tax=Puccinia coronata f. sp. avenae TaxID=200324 RepID=A0A2N5SFG4_9BASI|nr:hypothetical protein PCANC_24236 [Puccinia coronata f. sp. avenae]PLW34881.1 hypothetical protein PCANC_23750 [Puccinia coronata f. sp. avenae]
MTIFVVRSPAGEGSESSLGRRASLLTGRSLSMDLGLLSAAPLREPRKPQLGLTLKLYTTPQL